jgi:hypothetical protein
MNNAPNEFNVYQRDTTYFIIPNYLPTDEIVFIGDIGSYIRYHDGLVSQLKERKDTK